MCLTNNLALQWCEICYNIFFAFLTLFWCIKFFKTEICTIFVTIKFSFDVRFVINFNGTFNLIISESICNGKIPLFMIINTDYISLTCIKSKLLLRKCTLHFGFSKEFINFSKDINHFWLWFTWKVMYLFF